MEKKDQGLDAKYWESVEDLTELETLRLLRYIKRLKLARGIESNVKRLPCRLHPADKS